MTNSVSGYKEDDEERREDMNTNMKKEIYMHTLCTNNDDLPLCMQLDVQQKRRTLKMNCSLSLSISHVKVRTTYLQAVQTRGTATAQEVNGGVRCDASKE